MASSGRQDFFISYSHKDEDYALWIEDVLKQIGKTVNIQTNIVVGSDFVKKIGDFLNDSDGFIGVWSESYDKSQHCQSELSSAYKQFMEGKMKNFFLFRIQDYPIENALYAKYIRGDLFGLTPEEAILKLVGTVSNTQAQGGNRGPEFLHPFPGSDSQREVTKKAQPIFLPLAGSGGLITDPDDEAFHGYLNTYYAYFIPTHANTLSTLRVGTLTLRADKSGKNSFVAVDFVLRTGQISDGAEIEKRYEGIAVYSKMVRCCYCVLSSQNVGEMGFIMFNHFYLMFQQQDCPLALAMTAAAGGRRRYPTAHRMFLSRTQIRDEELEYIASFIKMNSESIHILQKDWDDVMSKRSYQEIGKLLTEGYAHKSTYYVIKEEDIRSAVRQSVATEGMKPTEVETKAMKIFLPLIADLRKHSEAQLNHKVSSDAEDIIRDFLVQKGYYANERKDLPLSP